MFLLDCGRSIRVPGSPACRRFCATSPTTRLRSFSALASNRLRTAIPEDRNIGLRRCSPLANLGSPRLASTRSTIDENYRLASQEAHQRFEAEGYDPSSFLEQRIAWGDQDTFQHLNNVQYLRFLESGRVIWLSSIGTEWGGPEKAQDMIKGRGISLILKSIQVDFKRPVTYPDTLLIAHKPHNPSNSKTQFNLRAVAYSYAQRAVVAESDCVVVWYDYEALKKCDPGEIPRGIVAKRIKG